MHPDLWTVPGIGFLIRTWGFCVAVGFILALGIAMRRAKRVKCDSETVLSMAIIGLVLGIIGCRGMHLVHHFRTELWSGAVGATEAAPMSGGGEILGGVVLAVAGVVGYLAVRRMSIRLYLDIIFPPMILGMGIGRIGCFMFGCCWGGVCATETGDKGLPWAVRFPYGSPAYVRQWAAGQIEVPGELIWKSPKTNRPEPILRGVLNAYDIDADKELASWAQKAERYAVQKKNDPKGNETTRLGAEMAAARQALADRSKEEFAAALHLRSLAGGRDARATAWAELRALAGAQRSLWVHPAQIYDAIALTLLFLLLSAIFYRRKRQGMVVAWALVLYPVNRILQEVIRDDNPHDVAGFTVSQVICVAILVAGVVLAVVFRKGTAPDSTGACGAPG